MKKRNGFQVMVSLIGLVKPLTGYMLLAIGMGVLGHLSATFITVLGGVAMVKIVGIEMKLTLTSVFLFIAMFAVLRGVLRYAEQACNHYIAFKLLALLRERVFMALRKLCPAKLEGKDKGNLISVITSDIELLEVFYAHTISPIAIAIIFSGFMCVFIGQYAILLSMIALVAYGIVGIVIPLVVARYSNKYGADYRHQGGELTSFVLESLRGLPEILQFSQGINRLEKMTVMTKELSKREAGLKRILGRNQGITNTVILFFDVLIVTVAAILYMHDQISFEGVVIPTITLMSSFGPVVALANLGSTLSTTFAAGNRVLDILEEEPVVQEICGKDKVDFKELKGENIYFSYAQEKILDKVSVEISNGEIVGITGKSGSGKSTLLKLFMRFWEVAQGKIMITHRDINEINTDNLRNMESFMTQETHLFCDSIANNIKIAKLDATEEEIIEACKKASLHEFIISLPEGYHTKVGELGETLSGGERQRIGLARAFLHNSDLLLLDEPTSNLDSLNEAIILKSICEEKGKKTVVLVSHRESTMGIADRSYCVEHGRMS